MLEAAKEGLVETDAAAIVFSDLRLALEFSKLLFQHAFEHRRPRVWLRGCVIPFSGKEPLRRMTKFGGGLDKIGLGLIGEELNQAIIVEKSGYKSLRLLVDDCLIAAGGKNVSVITAGTLRMQSVMKMRSNVYPKSISDKFSDFLWMATFDEQVFRRHAVHMAPAFVGR